jgi:hypothetical protein
MNARPVIRSTLSPVAQTTVRRAALADAAAIAGVHVRAWRAGYRAIVPDAVIAAQSVSERTGQWQGWLSGGLGGGESKRWWRNSVRQSSASPPSLLPAPTATSARTPASWRRSTSIPAPGARASGGS